MWKESVTSCARRRHVHGPRGGRSRLWPDGRACSLLSQNAIILGAIFYLLMSLGGGWPHLVILVLFGGLSLVGASLAYISVSNYRLDQLLNSGLDAWHPFFQYSSSMVQFF